MQTEIDRRFKEIEDRIDKLEDTLERYSVLPSKDVRKEVDKALKAEESKSEPIIEGLKKSAMVKEAVASVALDGETQSAPNTGRTISESERGGKND